MSDAAAGRLLTRDASVRESVATDWSGLHLVPEAVARPASEAEVVELLRWAATECRGLTAAGGQTSTTGASITDQGVLVSMRALDRVLDVDERARTVRVQAGALLGDVKRAVAAHGLLLAPDPTSEEECTVGGAIACNASGARTLAYGPTRPHVRALRVALADGTVADVRRPGLEKNTAGFALATDPVDWFVGSEGMLGVVLEAEFALLPRPAHVTGLLFPFPDEQDALAFVVAARDAMAALRPRCLEFLDGAAAAIFAAGAAGAAAAVDPEARTDALVYTEVAAPAPDDVPLDAWLALAERHRGRTDDVQVYDDEPALRAARRQRHAVPTTMNERAGAYRAAGGRRISTDWAVPYARLAEALAFARDAAERAGVPPAVVYGHAGNGHPHQNYIARSGEELERMQRVLEATLRHVLALGGTVSAEHGIGKLKRHWLPLQLSAQQLGVMRAVKRELDPLGILAPGNVL